MKREITAAKPTPVKAPKSPRGIENELADMIEFMVQQMAQRYKNQVLGKLQVSTVDKFADIAVEVDRRFRVVDRYETRIGSDENYDEDGNIFFTDSEYQHPIYRNEVRRITTMASDLRHDSDRVISFADAQSGNFASVLLKLAKSAQKRLLKQFSNGRIDSVSQAILAKLDKKSKDEFYKRVAGKVGIDVTALIAKEGMKSTTNALVAETSQWIKTLRDDTFQKFTNNTLFSMTQGESLDTIVGQFDDVVSERKNHAKFLARNQVQNYNSVTTKIRAQNLGITKAVWETSGDERVRPSHADRDGKEFDLAEGCFSSLDGEYLLPGTDYNCFPGDSQLNHTSLVHKLYRRWYSGELLSFVFDDGVVLKTTPNHPVLTTKGFKAAHLINTGDDVIRRLDEGVDTFELYGNRSIPTFEQIHTALDLLGVEHGVAPAISGKFHGDVSDSEVEVVAFDSLLMRKADASIREKLGKLNFSHADQVVVLALLTCNRDAIPVLSALGLSTDGIMRTMDLCRTLIDAHLTPLECFRFALGAWGDFLLDKPSADSAATHAKTYGDCIFAFSVLVHGRDLLTGKLDTVFCRYFEASDAGLLKMTLDGNVTNANLFASVCDGAPSRYHRCSVVEKLSANFSGHIYNLQTDTGDYITNTTAVSNCRCTYTMIIPETPEDDQVEDEDE